jgi:hypothetical protein
VPLKDVLAAHLRETEGHIDRLETILADLGEAPGGKKCKGMEGILEEGSEMISHVSVPALDAAIVNSGQRVVHYEIGGYRSRRPDTGLPLSGEADRERWRRRRRRVKLSGAGEGRINTTASKGEGILDPLAVEEIVSNEPAEGNAAAPHTSTISIFTGQEAPASILDLIPAARRRSSIQSRMRAAVRDSRQQWHL